MWTGTAAQYILPFHESVRESVLDGVDRLIADHGLGDVLSALVQTCENRYSKASLNGWSDRAQFWKRLRDRLIPLATEVLQDEGTAP